MTPPQFWLCASVLAIVLWTPVLQFLLFGRRAKRKAIRGSLRDHAFVKYLELFYRGFPPPSGGPQELFKEFFRVKYGPRHFVLPTAAFGLASSLVILVTVAGVAHMWSPRTIPPMGIPDPGAVAVAALAGAYIRVAWDMTESARARRMAPADLGYGVLRFVIAIPLALSLASLFTDVAGAPIAFLAGGLPTSELMGFMGHEARKKFGVPESQQDAKSEFRSIQGVSDSIARRFADEDISTLVQLAYCDPIDLAIRTNLDLSFVLDCTSQALVANYFPNHFDILKNEGLRGAYEIKDLHDELDGKAGPAAKSNAESHIDRLADLMKSEPRIVRRNVEEVALDPYTEFIHEVWN